MVWSLRLSTTPHRPRKRASPRSTTRATTVVTIAAHAAGISRGRSSMRLSSTPVSMSSRPMAVERDCTLALSRSRHCRRSAPTITPVPSESIDSQSRDSAALDARCWTLAPVWVSSLQRCAHSDGHARRSIPIRSRRPICGTTSDSMPFMGSSIAPLFTGGSMWSRSTR